MLDSYRHKGLRKKLVEEIKQKGITNEDVLKAINEVARHNFLDSSFLEYAYEDKPFPIGEGQTISQPYTVAFQTELLSVNYGDKVLEVGTGSGYQASILYSMGVRVYTIERYRSLYEKTKKLLQKLHIDVACYYGDGYLGLPQYAPYNGIIVTAAAKEIPENLKKQLMIGAHLVIPVGDEKTQKMKRIKRIRENEFIEEEFGYFSFVPLLKNKT